MPLLSTSIYAAAQLTTTLRVLWRVCVCVCFSFFFFVFVHAIALHCIALHCSDRKEIAAAAAASPKPQRHTFASIVAKVADPEVGRPLLRSAASPSLLLSRPWSVSSLRLALAGALVVVLCWCGVVWCGDVLI